MIDVTTLNRCALLVLCAAFITGCADTHLSVPPASFSQNRILYQYDVNGVNTWAIVPPSYNPQTPNRWIIYNHGVGEILHLITEYPPESTFVQTLATAGFVVIASQYRNLACWGNQECVDDIANLQTLWHSKLNLSPQPLVIGVSMGGIVTWNAISHGALKPLAVVGIYPVCNLAAVYTEKRFVPTIQTAYGFDSTAGFSAATNGFDPMLTPSSAFADIPIQMWASYSDRIVLRKRNEDPFAKAIKAAGGSVVIHTSKGNHGNPSNFDAPAVISFFSSRAP